MQIDMEDKMNIYCSDCHIEMIGVEPSITYYDVNFWKCPKCGKMNEVLRVVSDASANIVVTTYPKIINHDGTSWK